MNITLFKANMKANWAIFVFIFGMLMIYMSVSVAMFNPDNADAMEAMFSMLPEGMIDAFGFTGLGTELTTYLAGYLYGFIMIVFPIIYTIVLANNLVAKHVDRGSMAYILATPNTRIKIATTQAAYMILSTFVLLGVSVAILIGLSEAIFPGHLVMGSFIMLNVVTTLLITAVGGISFLASCIFNDTKYSLAFGAGIPVAFILFKMLADISDKVSFFRYFSFYTLLDASKILDDSAYATMVTIICIAVIAVLYTLGIIIFNKKSLSI